MLAIKNSHPRDARIRFEEKDHRYFVDGEPGYVSATTVIKGFFPVFDADAVLKKMRIGPDSPYHGQNREQIKAGWSAKAREASRLGTALHLRIERFFNGEEEEEDSVEYGFFRRFVEEVVEREGLVPYRTEWYVFDEDEKIAGSIDMVFLAPDGSLVIYDWKRTAALKRSNRFSRGLPPFEDLDDCSLNHYSLQLNLYRTILEKKYGCRISGMFLVCLHPDREGYERERVRDMSGHIDRMLRARRA